jgi:hypothetical protein
MHQRGLEERHAGNSLRVSSVKLLNPRYRAVQ